MGAHPTARRVCVLLLVAAAHLAGVLLIATLSRNQRVHLTAEADALLVVLLPPEPERPQLPRRTPPQPPNVAGLFRHPPAVAGAAPGNGPANATPTNAITIDWAAEGRQAAELQAEEDARARHRAAAMAAPHDPTFDPAPHPPKFHWDPVHANRVEPIEGGGTLIRLNDNCELVISVMIPLVGCALGKIHARGDLFEHMRDAPELGAWQDK